jgi:hypothetical protein
LQGIAPEISQVALSVDGAIRVSPFIIAIGCTDRVESFDMLSAVGNFDSF